MSPKTMDLMSMSIVLHLAHLVILQPSTKTVAQTVSAWLLRSVSVSAGSS